MVFLNCNQTTAALKTKNFKLPYKANYCGKWRLKSKYFLLCNKKSRFDFADELKVGDVRYKHLTQITIKVQLF